MADREANSEVAWPDTASPLYSQFDSAASCSICNDFYDTPLVLLCGHSCKTGCDTLLRSLDLQLPLTPGLLCSLFKLYSQLCLSPRRPSQVPSMSSGMRRKGFEAQHRFEGFGGQALTSEASSDNSFQEHQQRPRQANQESRPARQPGKPGCPC